MDCSHEISKLSVNNLGESQLGAAMFMQMLAFQTTVLYICSCRNEIKLTACFSFFFFLNEVHLLISGGLRSSSIIPLRFLSPFVVFLFYLFTLLVHQRHLSLSKTIVIRL